MEQVGADLDLAPSRLDPGCDIQFEALVEVPFRGAEGIGEGSKFTVEVDKFPIGTDPKAEQVKSPGTKTSWPG